MQLKVQIISYGGLIADLFFLGQIAKKKSVQIFTYRQKMNTAESQVIPSNLCPKNY